MSPAQRYLRRLRSFTPNTPVRTIGDLITGRVLEVHTPMFYRPGLVTVLVGEPSWYKGRVMFFTPDEFWQHTHLNNFTDPSQKA